MLRLIGLYILATFGVLAKIVTVIIINPVCRVSLHVVVCTLSNPEGAVNNR